MNEKEIEQYLIDFHKKELPNVLSRDLKIHSTKKIKTVIGPRRAGKTFFLYQLMQEFRKNNKEVLFLNFENMKLFGLQFREIKKIIDIHKRLFSPVKKPILFFDEPQNVDFWERATRELFDEDYNIFLSGSSSKLLSKEIFTSLRGRSVDYLLLPFSFKEFLHSRKFNYLTLLSSEEKLKLIKLLEEYFEFGGFPEVVLEDDNELKTKILESYFDLIVYKDIIERYKIRDSILVKWFIKSLASSYTKELSIHKIYLTLKSQGRKISKDEIYSFNSMVEDSLFAFSLPKFSNSIRKREPISKIYLCDIGFTKLTEIKDDIGKRMENVVYLELLRRKTPLLEFFYWKNLQQEEVDFVINEKGQTKELIQVCSDVSDSETKRRETRSLLKASKELKCKNLLIVTRDYESEEEQEWFDIRGKIKFIPLWKWLLSRE